MKLLYSTIKNNMLTSYIERFLQTLIDNHILSDTAICLDIRKNDFSSSYRKINSPSLISGTKKNRVYDYDTNSTKIEFPFENIEGLDYSKVIDMYNLGISIFDVDGSKCFVFSKKCSYWATNYAIAFESHLDLIFKVNRKNSSILFLYDVILLPLSTIKDEEVIKYLKINKEIIEKEDEKNEIAAISISSSNYSIKIENFFNIKGEKIKHPKSVLTREKIRKFLEKDLISLGEDSPFYLSFFIDPILFRKGLITFKEERKIQIGKNSIYFIPKSKDDVSKIYEKMLEEEELTEEERGAIQAALLKIKLKT